MEAKTISYGACRFPGCAAGKDAAKYLYSMTPVCEMHFHVLEGEAEMFYQGMVRKRKQFEKFKPFREKVKVNAGGNKIEVSQ